MKKLKIVFVFLMVLFSINTWSQVAINTSGSPANSSAMLDVSIITKGFLMPRMTTAQRLSISNPVAGLCVYDTDLGTYCYHNGIQWLPFGSGADYDWIISGTNMYSNVTGKVGIGTTNPGYKLTVDGGDALVVGHDGFNSANELARLYLGDNFNSIVAVHSYGLRLRTYNSTGHDIRIGAATGQDYMTVKMSTGYVGIGTTTPAARLHIAGPVASLRGQLSIEDNVGNDPFITFYEGTTFRSFIGHVDGDAHWGTRDGSNVIISGYEESGNVGIGTDNPDNVKLHVYSTSDVELDEGGILELGPKNGNNLTMDGNEIMARYNNGTATLYFNHYGGNNIMSQNGTGNVGIGVGSPASRLDVKGNVTIRNASTGSIVMELGTGLDYAEGFDVSDSAVLPGTVLVIDAAHPGKLRISEKACDTRVAGIVAGANSLGSGVKLGVDNYDCSVALAGRVYCNVDASRSAIEPGDLLTTSELPGYAMKADDDSKAQGAILGKAMERMEKGRKGQILVLVTLQ